MKAEFPADKNANKKKKVHPAVPTKTVLMSIHFLPLKHWFLIFIHCIFSYFHLFKCRNILAIFKILWLFPSQMAKMALRYYMISSHRVGNTFFCPAPAIVLITKGRLPMLLHLQPLPAIFLFIAPRTPSN